MLIDYEVDFHFLMVVSKNYSCFAAKNLGLKVMMKRTLVDLPQFGWQTSYYLRQFKQVIEASFKPIIVTLIEENFEDFIQGTSLWVKHQSPH